MKKTIRCLFLFLALLPGMVPAQTQSPKPAATSQGAAAPKEDCGCEAKVVQPDVYGTVNGIKISAKDIDDLIAAQIKQLQTAVVDARKRLGVAPAETIARTPSGKPRRAERLVVCRVGSRRVGVLVDAVAQVRRVSRDTLKPAPLPSAHVLGVTGEGAQLTMLLDVKALLTE